MGRHYPKATDLRNRELALIHLAKRDLCLSDDEYRALLWSVARVNSSADLDWRGRKLVLDHFLSCGFKVQRAQQPGQTHKSLAADKAAIERKIGAQLKALDAGWPYAYAVSKRQFPDVARFEFLTAEQLGKVASALERTIKSRQTKAAQ
ncbi:hypothetical protein OYT1_ch1644 [Ferriphaselus amnicola]|uniref:Regulatory protein GemA n=1 Tax=Ferriphaselus amnicola TaxID=1188319 RepID=A0A2Z6GCZ1_9PROT|nr:regulatory protein GemA [Ferriphaselus amnicola]BBE51189.1 hypothetical protein OYT1_ch1644 [Ferriphaselus amnicola]